MQMTGEPTLLAVLLEKRGLERYGAFCAAYQKAARSLDSSLDCDGPSRAQFHRWTTGGLRTLPYTGHCRVLEHMLTGYSAGQLLTPCPDRSIPAPARASSAKAASPAPQPAPDLTPVTGMAGVEAVFASRSEFAARVEPRALLDDADTIRASGLSLNLICQQIPDQYLLRHLTGGTQLTCLFLDPDGDAIQAREREEQYQPGFLSNLTKLNIEVIARLRDRLPAEARDRLRLAAYDETIRFNILLAGDHTCVAQPYLPHARGVEAPTLLIRNTSGPGGLYPVFEQVYEALAERSRPL
jgi:hypothetical protein